MALSVCESCVILIKISESHNIGYIHTNDGGSIALVYLP